MNSITYLDSVLSRSFNTDNSGSNSNSSSNNATPNPSPRRPTKASSSNNLKSRSSSHLPDLRGFEDGYGRESLEPASSVSATSSPNPKSKDKTNARLRRTGSTPAGVYSSHPNGSEENLSRPARWSGLWSLAGWLDPTATPPSDPTSSQPATQPAVNRARRMPSLDDLLIGGSSLANKPIIKAQQRRSASSGNRPAGRESEPERGGRLATGRRPAYRDLADLVIAGRNRNSSALADDDDDEDEDDGGHDDEPSSESSSLEEDPESMIRYDDQGVQVGSETQAEAAEEEQVEEEEKAAALRSSEREEDEEVDQSLLPSLGSSTPLSNRVLADPVADVRGDPSDSWPVSTPSDPPPSSFPQEGIDGEPSSKDTAGGEESWGGVEAQTVLRHGSAQGNDEGLPPSLEYDEGGREEETHDTAGGQSEAPQRTGSVTRRVRRSRPGTVESSSSAESSISSSSSSSPSSSTSGSPRYRTATSSVSNLAPNETSTAMPLEERSLSDAAGWMGGVEDTGSIVDAQTLIRRRFTVWMGLRKALLALLDAILAVLLFPIHLARSRWIRRDGYGRVRNEQGRSGGAGWSEGKIQDHARDRDEKGGEGEGHEGMEASHDGSKPRRRASSIRFASQSPGGVRQRSVEKRRPRTPRPDDVPTPDPSLLGSTPVGSSGDGSDEAGRGRFDSAFGKEISRRRGDWEPFSSSSSSSASCSSGSSSTSDEEPVTEEQAIAREERRRRRRMRRRRAGGESRLDSGSNEEGKDENTDLGEENEKVKGEGEEDLGWNPKVMSRKPSKSKLLPNPHPIDPMLVGNKDAKPIDEEKAMLEAMQASERSLRVRR
ncbi:hypothetical protein IE53DRAFT_271276 [Violaceomyces palustris]|uniref:Uncharacterized protein n=1 Tax=Violaceomyces palustris TaxID=1673888 RepID=A0ACD0NMT4_9BASI|nr:hypothetical protein IE53DRAFT_271276 [Violaceomyces palustris]